MSDKALQEKQEMTPEEAFDDLTEKNRRFLLYFLGSISPGDTGYQGTYGNATMSYFHAYYVDDPELEEVSTKKQVQKVNDDGDVEVKEVFTKEYQNAASKASLLLKKENIKQAMRAIRNNMKPLEKLKEVSNQRIDMNVAVRAAKLLLEHSGDLDTEAESFAKKIRQMAADGVGSVGSIREAKVIEDDDSEYSEEERKSIEAAKT